MKISITKEICHKYPDLRIGYFVASDINNMGDIPKELLLLLENIERIVRERFDNIDSLAKNQYITIWRDVYAEMGLKPNKVLPTVESLCKRILKGKTLPTINKAVNAYLCAELQTLIPVGGYDMTFIEGGICLRLAEEGEKFTGIDDIESLTRNGEIVYADESSILTRNWNYRDCKKAQITEMSKHVCLFAEAPTQEISDDLLMTTMSLISEFVSMFCGGNFSKGIIDCRMGSDFEI